MAIKFSCQQCGKIFSAQEKYAGRYTKCPVCGRILQISTPAFQNSEETMTPAPPPLSPDSLTPDSDEWPKLPPLFETPRPSSALTLTNKHANGSQRPRSAWSAAIIMGLCVAFGLGGWTLGRIEWVGPSHGRRKTVDAPQVSLLPVTLREATTVPDYSRWQLQETFRWNHGEVTCVAFSSDGRTIAVGGGTHRRTDTSGDPIESGLLQLWDTKSGAAKLSVADSEHEIRSVVFYPDGATLAVSDRRKTRVIDAQSGATRVILPSGSHFPIALNPRRNVLAIKPDVFYDSLSGQPIPSPITNHGTNMVFSPDGTLLCEDLDLWNLDTGKQVARLSFPGTSVRSTLAAFSHDGKMIAMEYGLWKTAGGQRVWSQAHDKSRFVTGVAFTPDDGFVLTSDRNGELRISEVSTGRVARVFRWHDEVEGLALSPDGALLVTIGTAADGLVKVKVWRASTREAE